MTDRPDIPEKRKFNFKYHVLAQPEFIQRKDALKKLAEDAAYTGNPKHKKAPGDFGLTPPADPRPNASLCDNAGIFEKAIAQNLLEEAFRKGLVDRREQADGWPKAVWIIYGNNVLQAMHEGRGKYHGFPLPDTDPICKEVRQAWDNRE